MIEAIQAAAAGASQAVPGATAATQQPQASNHEVRDFAASMQRAGGANGAETAQAGAAQASESQGTRAVLAALDNLNGGADKIANMSKTLSANSADFTPAEMVQLTMRSHQFLFTSQLTSNVANRTSDGIQQLFRQQS